MAATSLTEFLSACFVEDDLAAGRDPARYRVRRRVFLALAPRSVLQHMARARADHPDFDPAWR